jgi:CDP-diacylglycerol--glycerol-3-phosphate 3-phosphatidyltransferase
MNLALRITTLRVALVPVFVALFVVDTPAAKAAALVVFALGALTDTVDGIVARRCNQVTRFGMSFDPLADKLLVTAALICLLGERDLAIPAWTVVVIVMRDYIITWLRSLDEHTPIPADATAKLKTFVQSIVIIGALGVVAFREQLLAAGADAAVLAAWTRGGMVTAAVFTAVSGAVYLVRYRGHIAAAFSRR